MKAVVGTVAKQVGLLVVGALVEVVAQLMVDGGEVIGADFDAHFDAEVVGRIEVPRGGVADDFGIAGMHELGALPERFGKRREAEGPEEVFAVVHHVVRGGELGGMSSVGAEVGAGNEGWRGGGVFGGDLLLERGLKIEWLELREFRIDGRNDVVDVAPLLGPHVAQELSGDHTIGAVGSFAILGDEASAHIVVQRAIERLELLPGVLELGGELRGGHVVARAPEFAGIVIAEFFRANVLQCNVTRIFIAHGGADGVPTNPQTRELLRIMGFRHEVGDLVDPHAFCAWRGRLTHLRVWAVLSFAVHAGQFRRELGLLSKKLWILGRSGRVELHEQNLTAQDRRKLEMIEAVALLGEGKGARGGLGIEQRDGSLGVFGDIGIRNPLGACVVGADLEQLGAGAADEGLGVGDGGRGGRLGKSGRCSEGEGQGVSEAGAHGGSISRHQRRGAAEM